MHSVPLAKKKLLFAAIGFQLIQEKERRNYNPNTVVPYAGNGQGQPNFSDDDVLGQSQYFLTRLNEYSRSCREPTCSLI